eukprot:TRINITY_DN6199_c0_g2_i2.p1 TRINITY_DN6199_c0_g2~~TRINITY_DN6199_c0_g2_i2.p1  ORF type:complete len:1212 (+),score=538.97 TRINITY_DN6199_c0_g2_i2:118-3753(+)
MVAPPPSNDSMEVDDKPTVSVDVEMREENEESPENRSGAPEPPPNPEPLLPLVIWDSTYSSKPISRKSEISPNMTFTELKKKAAEMMNVEGQEELLIFKQVSKGSFNWETNLEKKVSEIFPMGGKVIFSVTAMSGLKVPHSAEHDKPHSTQPTIIKEETSNSGSHSASSSTENRMIIHPSSNMMLPSSYGSISSSYSSSWNNNEKQKSGYVGLGNQGATCYMNSLIQTLFMTPEFRSALYKWNFETYYENWKKNNNQKEGVSTDPSSPKISEEENRSAREKKSIPRQLQLLFARLQTCDQRAAKTKELTNSFGWKDSDAFTQHDVQELCRVLFDALESVLKGTEQENLINELYQGEMKDYVTCLECGNESSRTDKYLDVPLVIKGFGEEKAIGSVEEALQKFVTPEDLSGENQYNCEKCGKKVDAKKGLKFTSFPYLLTLQLKRFDFDYQSMKRKKLNDKVTFPHILDLNSFLGEDNSNAPEGLEKQFKELDGMASESDGSETEPTTTNGEEEDSYSAGASKSGFSTSGKVEEEPKVEKNHRKTAIELVQKRGKFIYELYSVLIHRGSALGGHYYAYIKSFTTGKWYEFNDSSVTEIKESEIENTFGEEEKKTGYMYSSGANAYMLMYRRVDEEKNMVESTEIPSELKEKLDDEVKKQEEKTKKEEQKKNSVDAKVVLWKNGESVESKDTNLMKYQLIKDVLPQVQPLFESTKDLPLDRLRLRKAVASKTNTERIEAKGPLSLENNVYTYVNHFEPFALILEVREEGEEFEDYNPNLILVKVFKQSEKDEENFEGPIFIKVNQKEKIEDQLQVLADSIGVSLENLRIVRPEFSYSPTVFYPFNSPYGRDLKESEKYYLEDSSKSEEKDSFAMKAITREQQKLTLKLYILGEKEPVSFECSKKDTIGKLRELISQKYNIAIDQFKLMKGITNNWPTELKQDEKELSSIFTKEIWVEKGQPSKDGEESIQFFKFDPIAEVETEKPLFEMVINKKHLNSDVKIQVAKKLKEDNIADHDPKHIRLIEISNYRKGTTVYPDKLTFDLGYHSVNTKIGFQLMDKEEIKDERDDVFLMFARRFNPSTLTFGTLDDVVLTKKTKAEELRKFLQEKYQVESVALGKDSKKWGGVMSEYEVLDETKWDVSSETADSSVIWNWACEGDTIYWKDKSEKDIELSPEEKKKQEAEKKKRNQSKGGSYSYYRSKEEALKINTSDN